MDRLFTYDEANDLVPWLEERFAAMQPARAELVDEQENLLSCCCAGGAASPDPPLAREGNPAARREIAAAEQEVARLTRRLQDAVNRKSPTAA